MRGKKNCSQDGGGDECGNVEEIRTRPDNRLPKSRAGGQGPYLRSQDHLGRSSEVQK